MAKTKKRNKGKSKSSGGRKNSASVRKAASHAKQTVVKYRARPVANKPKANRKRKKGKRRNGLFTRNGFTFKGLNAMDLGVGALSLITTQALSQAIRSWVDPQSYLGIGVQIGMAAGVYALAPASVRNAATLGAGITPTANLINRLTGNVIGSTIESTVRGFLPAQAVPAEGLGAFVNVPAQSPLNRGAWNYAN